LSLFDYLRRHAKAVIFCIVILTLAGIVQTLRLPVSLFPNITFPRLVILADNGEQPAERMMIEVTKPLEEVAGSVPGVKVVRSITGRGSTEISVGLDWGSDVQKTLQILQGRIADVRNILPPTASIQAEQMSVAVFPILGYSLTSEKLSQVELREIAYFQIRPALLRVNGVARVEVTGGERREFSVTIDPEKLEAYRLDIGQVSDAIDRSNLVASAGLVDNNHQLYLSLVSGILTNADNIAAVVIAVRNGVPVHVGDIARVQPSVAPNYIRTTAHGRPAVLINIIKQPAGSTVQIGKDVKAAVAALTLPSGVHFENWYDQGDFIDSSITSTRDSIIVGIILSMVVLVVFLRNWRITTVMAVVVPVTVATTLVCLHAIGETINIMTLGGIAAAVGLIIDDSIVVIENIFTLLSQPLETASTPSPLSPAVSRTLRDLMPAIIGSTACTVVINIPLAFLGGVTGAFFASLSKTMIFALLSSFIFSITLAPLLVYFILKITGASYGHTAESRPSRMSLWYERVLRGLLNYRYLAIPSALIIGALTYYIYSHTGSGFMPDMDEGTFVLDYVSPPGTSLDETDRMLMKVEHILLDIPEVDTYSRRTGTQLGFFLTEPNNGDFLVKLKKERKRAIDDIIAEVRQKIELSEPALEVDFGQLMMDVIGDLTNNPKPIEIKLFGDDQKLLQAKAKEISGIIDSVPGVVDVFDGIVISGPSLVIDIDPVKAALAGMTTDDVQKQLEGMVQGKAESMVQKGEKMIGIRVQYPEDYHHDLNRIEGSHLINSSGILIPLRDIAKITLTGGQAEIHREGLRQCVAVTARIEGRDLGRTIDDIKRKLSTSLNVPHGISPEYGGVYQTQQESFRSLFYVAAMAFVLVFIVLLFEFGEFAVPIAVLMVSLLSLVGVVIALWLCGVTFNISSFVGLIMIIGIVAENGIFVMHQTKMLLRDGTDLDTALIQAVQMRARPIVMTTLAAILALLPLALGMGTGAQMQQPLAIAVIGGFSVSSGLLFFGLPVGYRLLKRI
jgi:CzcA family heavy metal efflux pump